MDSSSKLKDLSNLNLNSLEQINMDSADENSELFTNFEKIDEQVTFDEKTDHPDVILRLQSKQQAVGKKLYELEQILSEGLKISSELDNYRANENTLINEFLKLNKKLSFNNEQLDFVKNEYLKLKKVSTEKIHKVEKLQTTQFEKYSTLNNELSEENKSLLKNNFKMNTELLQFKTVIQDLKLSHNKIVQNMELDFEARVQDLSRKIESSDYKAKAKYEIKANSLELKYQCIIDVNNVKYKEDIETLKLTVLEKQAALDEKTRALDEYIKRAHLEENKLKEKNIKNKLEVDKFVQKFEKTEVAFEKAQEKQSGLSGLEVKLKNNNMVVDNRSIVEKLDEAHSPIEKLTEVDLSDNNLKEELQKLFNKEAYFLNNDLFLEVDYFDKLITQGNSIQPELDENLKLVLKVKLTIDKLNQRSRENKILVNCFKSKLLTFSEANISEEILNKTEEYKSLLGQLRVMEQNIELLGSVVNLKEQKCIELEHCSQDYNLIKNQNLQQEEKTYDLVNKFEFKIKELSRLFESRIAALNSRYEAQITRLKSRHQTELVNSKTQLIRSGIIANKPKANALETLQDYMEFTDLQIVELEAQMKNASSSTIKLVRPQLEQLINQKNLLQNIIATKSKF